MATAAPGFKSVELFYSYAHGDQVLCEELQKHLTALKRAGLIRDWYDRKIEPGSEWAVEIQTAMERAGLILLLISADFLASPYIFEVELPFALKRHASGLATVIPVLLRPVEWRDLPFAKLQVLPTQARPVTLWPNSDQAFSDIAGRLRELIYEQRLGDLKTKDIQPLSVTSDDISTQERVLDAALASTVVVDEPTDLVAMFRTTESGGLKAILKLDRIYSPTSEDVKSNTLEIDFPQDPSGKRLPATLRIAIESPGFDPPSDHKTVRIPNSGDSAVFVFMLMPKRAGILKVNLQILLNEVVIGSRLLATNSVAVTAAAPTVSYGVVCWPVAMPANPPIASAQWLPLPAPVVYAPARAMPSARPPFVQRPKATAMPAAAARKSGRKLWLIAGSSAAAIAVLLVTTTQFSTNTATPTYSTSGLPRVTVVQPRPEVPPDEDDLVPRNEDQLRASLAAMHSRATSIRRRTTRPLLPSLVAAQTRLAKNLEKADNALQSHQRTLAHQYLIAAQKDLNTLEAATR